jgi:hypothetical protein
MPVHDWSQIEHGIFHDFHQAWTIGIRNGLNGGTLPAGYFALAEQFVAGPVPDAVTLQRQSQGGEPVGSGGLAVVDAPPRAAYVISAENEPYAARANRIVVKHRLGQIVAVIEIVSPGNKSSHHALKMFVEKACDLLQKGIHLLIIDLLPPTPRDPQGIHKAIWDTLSDEPLDLPANKPLRVAAYYAGVPKTAYVDPLAVGDSLPSSPLFLDDGLYVPAPLEATYQKTWRECPSEVRELVEGHADGHHDEA